SDYGVTVPPGRLSGQVKTTCPKCSHDRRKKHDKCLSVNLDQGCWHCHHCGWSYRLNGVDKQPLEQWKNETKLPDHVAEWFIKRNIKQATLNEMHIGWTQKFFPQTGSNEPCIVFPYYK